MSEFYLQKRKSARLSIAKRGAAAVISYTEGATPDLTTGGITGGTPKTMNVVALLFPVKQKKKGDAITQTKFTALTSAEDNNGVALPVVPTSDMGLTVGGVDYIIETVEPLRPGGIDIMYTLTVSI